MTGGEIVGWLVMLGFVACTGLLMYIGGRLQDQRRDQ